MRYLIGPLFIPAFQYGTFKIEALTPEQLKAFVRAGTLGQMKVLKPKANAHEQDTYDVVLCIAEDIQSSLSVEERDRVLEFTGLHVNPLKSFRLQKIEVGDQIAVCRYAYAENYNQSNYQEIWDVSLMTRIG